MRARVLCVMVAAVTIVAATSACDGDDASAIEIQKTTQASTVVIDIHARGKALGTCSGTLVAKDLVLTAGHCAAGAARWRVTSPSTGTTVDASRAVTPWKAFGSRLSHPDHADVALLVLDAPIELDRYPAIAKAALPEGSRALHMHRASERATEAQAAAVEIASGRSKGFRLNYATKIEAGTYLDTGGAIVDPKTGRIHGVVSGRGETSGLLFIARVDNYATWIGRSQACGAALTTRGYGSSSGGSSSGYGGGEGGGDWGGYGGGKKVDAGPLPSSDGGAPYDAGGSADSGASAPSTPSDSENPGSDSTAGSGDGKCPPPPSCEGDCPGGSKGAETPGGKKKPGGGEVADPPKAGGADEVKMPSPDECPGPPDCPEPDDQRCNGPSCGGCSGAPGCVDTTIDYGNCASCGEKSGGSGPVVR
ncbi:MAG: trypsin-like serine protease [Labilithrix sp.]|nr:trypsin-like serine protease [Labilithrix sp.]